MKALAGTAVGLLALLCGPAAWAGGGPDIEAGRAAAERNCARCHATGNAGDSALAQAPPFRTFAKKWPLENLEEALAEGIVVGHKAMPEFELSTTEISDLIAYLETLQ